MAIDLFTIGHFTVHGYGLMIGLGFIAAVLSGGWLAKRHGLSEPDFTNMAMLVLIFGFVGGKLLHMIVEFKTLLSDPMEVIGSAGFVVYGGILSGIATIYVYCRIRKLKFMEYLDIFATAVPINQALGRVGCLLAGCCYGKETDSAFSLVFPEGSMAPPNVRLIPTQPLMAAGDLIMFVIIVYVYLKKYRPGIATALYLILYSLGRFVIEFFRADERGEVAALSTSQFIAIFTFAAGIFLFVKIRKDGRITDE